MKLYLTLLAPLLLLFSACQKNEYVDVIDNRTIIVNVPATSWTSTNGGKSYFATVDMPEITNEFNERGGVLVYLTFGNRTYEKLPQVSNGVSYRFTSSPGHIDLGLESSDPGVTISPPGQTITAKIILVESQF
ncbi:hypothetical protein [Desertivirga arenae]|uniref:hypothetical protein n=1 Tax=Desertivirga arenae TaxID=2810309 RepID=UPI001A956D7B|nr:hypothetical protein [Pedobacter sp. SYSU D00823]